MESDVLEKIVDPLSGEDNWPTETILDEAARLTSGDRQRDYDHPLPNHRRIARLWNAFLAIRQSPSAEISAEDVAKMMILLKIARDAATEKRDSLIDIAGYARCLEKMRASQGDTSYVP